MDATRVQSQIDLLSPQKKLSLFRILKSQGINVHTESGPPKIPLNALSPKILNVIERMKKDEVFVIQASPETKEENSDDNEVQFEESTKTPKKGKTKRVTIMEDVVSDSETNEKEIDMSRLTTSTDIDEIERRMKQSITLKPSQLKIKRKIKDLLKKIAKHKHACPEKNYGQELNDREDDGGGIGTDVEDDAIVIEDNMEGETNLDISDDDNIDDKTENESEFAGENDDIDNLSATIFDETEDDESKLIDDTDTEEQTDDATSVFDEIDDGTDVDEELLENMVESEMNTFPSTEVDNTRLNFKNTTMKERYIIYKGLLESNKKMEFGNLDDLGFD